MGKDQGNTGPWTAGTAGPASSALCPALLGRPRTGRVNSPVLSHHWGIGTWEHHRTHLDSDPKKPISQTESKKVETSYSGRSPGLSTPAASCTWKPAQFLFGASLLGPWPPPSTWQAKELGRCCHGNQSWLSLIVRCPHALWVPSATPPPIEGFSRPRLPHTAPSLSPRGPDLSSLPHLCDLLKLCKRWLPSVCVFPQWHTVRQEGRHRAGILLHCL